MRLLPIITIIMSCGLIENNKKNKNPLFVAAQDAGFLRDQQVASDVERFNKKIVEAKYIESLMVGRVSVGISEITNYYETNKNQFKRLDDEALVLIFEQLDKSGAIKIKNVLDRNNFDSERVSEVMQKNEYRRVFLKKNSLKTGMSERIFKTKNKSFITQEDGVFVVFYIINLFKKGTLKDLVDVSDSIQSRILAIKKLKLKEQIIDSLSVIYGTN